VDASILDWIAQWEACIRARDYRAARPLFREDVLGFGTHSRIACGLDELEKQQWRQVWPGIDDFRFELAELRVSVSPDGQLACAMLPWTSIGHSEDGAPFRRPGRATLLLASEAGDWKGFHTHFSLNPGTAPHTFAPPTR